MHAYKCRVGQSIKVNLDPGSSAINNLLSKLAVDVLVAI
jgi:hypothetical protein